jgi:hypothetical protein
VRSDLSQPTHGLKKKIHLWGNPLPETQDQTSPLGFLVDSEIVLSTRYGKTMVFINKTLSTETTYQQELINRDLLSTRLIVDKVGSGIPVCGVTSLTVLLMYWCVRHKGK